MIPSFACRIGSAPVVIEPCTVVAVAEGADGFLATPSYDA